jgi:hypothetical protein
MKDNRNRNTYRVNQEKMSLFGFGGFAERSSERGIRLLFSQ